MTATTAGTGRIHGSLSLAAQRLYYGAPDDAADRTALGLFARVDRAHLVMLAEQGTIPREAVVLLLRAVARIEAGGFADVLGRPRPRGLYLAYEQALTARIGPEAGGRLHTGRSRNDLGATTTLLTLRETGLLLLADGNRLVTAILQAATRHLDVVMPVHTHFQPAMPITYGYYLTGVALALSRDLDRMAQVIRGIRECPLGAHAVAGTDVVLDTGRTAALLGFEYGPVHAVDAIASRDASIAALAAAAGAVTTVSRLATDLQFWSSADLAYLEFPDWLVGSSSAMPQKRNAFLLEYLKGRPHRVTGAWVTAVSAVACTPFTNSIEVGTEAMAVVLPALETTRDVLATAALVVSGAVPRPQNAQDAAARGFVDATAHASELVRRGVPFREAHERVGAAVLRVVTADGDWPPDGLPPLTLTEAVDRARYGGGPGARAASLAAAWDRRHRLQRELRERRESGRRAAGQLREAAEALARG